MGHIVTFFPKNSTVEVDDRTTILEAATEAGVHINAQCGGEGKCGRCRVIVEGAVEAKRTELIDEIDWENGYRLACQSDIVSDLVVFVPQEAQVGEHKILTTFHVADVTPLSPLAISSFIEMPCPTLDDNLGDLERVERALGMTSGELDYSLEVLRALPSILRDSDWRVNATVDRYSRLVSVRAGKGGRDLGLAIDVGTTTVVVSLVDLSNGEMLSQSSDYNKQIVCGEDVLSRIAFCEDCDVTRPNRLVVDTLNTLIGNVIRDVAKKDEGMPPGLVSCASIAGNTTMMHLLLGLDPKGIRYEPYIPVTNIPPIMRAGELGIAIAPDAPVYIVPGRASYVGGDIIADVLASEMHLSDETALLIDVGTNGEIVLGNGEWMVACSCSAGPAFEGGEVAHGMRAMVGAIDSIGIGNDGELSYTVIGDEKPIGICGSGLIDLLASLFLRGILDKKGHIQVREGERIREGEEGMEYVVAWENETATAEEGSRTQDVGDIVITDNDIQNIIRTKAAVYAAASVLLNSVEMDFTDLSKVYVAGGFGNYLDIEKAQVIGLLPDIPQERFVFMGNGALAGARLTLLSEDRREQAKAIHDRMTYFELSTTQAFFDEFSSSLFLPHTEIGRFPNISRMLLGQ
jgi:uncharacterized 2Fe-2S/4Fe-4S cluster protein (DUF4445 family)